MTWHRIVAEVLPFLVLLGPGIQHTKSLSAAEGHRQKYDRVDFYHSAAPRELQST